MKRKFCFALVFFLLTVVLEGCGAPAQSAAWGSSVSAAVDSEGDSSAKDTRQWEQQALFLTEQIIDSCLQPFDEAAGIDTLNDREIFNFICTVSHYCEEPEYPYAGMVTITTDPGLVAHIPEQAAQTIAYQLFGQSGWSYNAPDCYDSAVPEYRFNLEAGSPYSLYSCQDATAEFTGNTVTVSFRLTDSLLFVGATGDPFVDYGSFEAVYRLVSEEGLSFLWLKDIRPV